MKNGIYLGFNLVDTFWLRKKEKGCPFLEIIERL